MQDGGRATRAWLPSVRRSPPVRRAGTVNAAPSTIGDRPRDTRDALLTRWTRGVEYLVRTARITDIERLVALAGDALRLPEGATSPLGAADLFRQLVYLPQADIEVAEARREVVGGAILVLRPSVSAGGYVGSVDLLVVDPDHDVDRVTEALLEELLRSAQNKGCTVVEAVRPDDPDARARWERLGFVDAVPLVSRSVAARIAARRS